MTARPGVVHLVGAGPGDPQLMTLRSVALIESADAIVHDRLIPAGALDGARPDAELHDAGKWAGGAKLSQAEINALLVELARAGKSVVRLKGGDPFVFGRGGEEAQALRAAGIRFEVVPAATAGVAVPAHAGIPVTQRGVTAAVAFVSGHEAPDLDDRDWRALAAFPGTLVFYMGVATLPVITARLVAGGRPPAQPAAVIADGTLAGQRTVAATLGGLAQAVRDAQVRSPAITVIGDVAALHDELRWVTERDER